MLKLGGATRIVRAMKAWIICYWGDITGCKARDWTTGWLVYGDNGGDYGGTILFCGEVEDMGCGLDIWAIFLNLASFNFRKGWFIALLCYLITQR